MNRFWLKAIACLTMLADHICYAFFSGNAAASTVRLTVGRIAFPLFAFMIVRGFLYTRSRLKYGLSMLVTALASEIIYDRLFHGRIFYWRNQNIIFLLLLGLIMLCVLDRAEQNVENPGIRTALQIAVVGGCCAAACYLKLDYSFWGILVIVLFYYFRNAPFYVSGVLACLPLAAGYSTYGAFLAVIPLAFYNETGGRMTPAGKYAFYLFYPGHLALLLLIKSFIL